MWSRLAVSVNRNLASRSLVCLQNRYIHQNSVYQKYNVPKEIAVNPKYQKSNEHQAKKISPPIRDKPTDKVLVAQNDPQSFGTLNRQVAEHEADDGDIAVDEYYRTIPLRRDQLPQRKYEHMIKTFIRDKRLKEAIDVLEVRMKEDRVKPDQYIYQLLIMELGRWVCINYNLCCKLCCSKILYPFFFLFFDTSLGFHKKGIQIVLSHEKTGIACYRTNICRSI